MAGRKINDEAEAIEQRDQARALIRVARALRSQLNAYRRLFDLPADRRW